jgi:hypothetical protein
MDRRDEEEQAADAVEGSGHETILVVEDDRDVRAYLVEVLRDLNYRVLSAHDAVAALGLIEEGDIRIDLLLTDVVLPGTNGRQLAEQAQNPATRSQSSVHDGLFPKCHRPPRSARSLRRDDPKADHTRGPRRTDTRFARCQATRPGDRDEQPNRPSGRIISIDSNSRC